MGGRRAPRTRAPEQQSGLWCVTSRFREDRPIKLTHMPSQQLSALTLAAISLTTYPILLDSAQDPPLAKTSRVVSAAEVRKHNSRESCWVVVEAPEEGVYKVWDVTRWLDSHPGASFFSSPTSRVETDKDSHLWSTRRGNIHPDARRWKGRLVSLLATPFRPLRY